MILQKKLLSFLIPLVSLLMLAVGVITYSQESSVLYDSRIDEMKRVTDQLGLITTDLIATTKANAILFSESTLVQKYLLTTDEDDRYLLMQPSVLRLFASYQKAYPQYDELRLLLPNGFEETRLSTNNSANLTEHEGQSSFFTEIAHARDDVQALLLNNPDNGLFSLMVSRRIFIRDQSLDPVTAAKSLRGYLLITARLDRLTQQLQTLRIGKSGRLVATDRQGNVVLNTQGLNGTNISSQHASFSEFQEAAHDQIIKTLSIDGQPSLVLGKKIDKNLYLFAILPQKELQSSINALAVKTLMVAILAIILLTALLYRLLKYLVVTPVAKLRNAAEAIGQGNFNTEVNVTSNDEIGQLASSFRQMSRDLQKSRDQISYLAYHDSLTGLPNRLMFKEYLSHAIEIAKREDSKIALLFLDLDNFKHINDTIGHHAGDQLLQNFADKLKNCLRGSDFLSRSTVARLGGDEFLMLLPGVNDKTDCDRVAQRLVQVAAEPFLLNDNEFHVSASIGISLYPQDGETVDALIRNADAAMYHAKSDGKNTYHFYSPQMNEKAIERVNLEGKLRHAIENDELILYYQPQYNTRTSHMFGVEALLRWNHPELGMVAPDRFIPIAEETGLIIPIGEWVIQEACNQLHQWQKIGLGEITISVNVSSVQLSRIDIRSLIAKHIQAQHISANLLTIELTESTIMESPMRAAEVLHKVKKMGVSISMDDFGTGYSSLSYLRRFPIDHLKIDRSFITEVTENADDEAIVSAIIAMSESLNLSVIAEGVETKEQLALLARKGCYLVQGYLLGRPQPAAQIEQLLKDNALV